MNPQIAQRIAMFLQRTTLNPQEIPDFNVCMQTLQSYMQPTEVPKQEKEDGDSQQHPDKAGGE
jgi:hypothetical protein